MKKNVLVFPCGSEIGLEIHKSLGSSIHFKLIGASSTDDHGSYIYENYVNGLPFIDDPSFIDKLNEIIDAYKIDFIFPAHDSVVLKLAQEKAAGTLKCGLITSPLETCTVARSKAETYKVMDGVVPTPKVYQKRSDLPSTLFPIFLKPDVGQGSKGTQLARTEEDIEFYYAKDPSLMLLEYLPGKEYTIDCFTNKDGELLFAEGRERIRIANGISVSSESVRDARFKRLAEAINSKLVFRGVWFFQVKENQAGDLVLMEVAPRIAGTMGLVRCKGVNLALLSLFDAMGLDVEITENSYTMSIDRALQNSYKHNLHYNHVYLDFDDLVLFEGKVNPNVMAFVFQCRNKGITVHLLTKHRANLTNTLKKYRLSEVFDEVIWIQDDRPKHTFIKEPSAIFIDDSFSERREVKEKLSIPVFDLHMLESLQEQF